MIRFPVYIFSLLLTIGVFTLPVRAQEECATCAAGAPARSSLPALIRNGRAMVPVRSFAEGFGAVVSVNPGRSEVTIDLHGKQLILMFDNDVAWLDGKTQVIWHNPPRLISGTAYAPLSPLVYIFGLRVEQCDGKLCITHPASERSIMLPIAALPSPKAGARGNHAIMDASTGAILGGIANGQFVEPDTMVSSLRGSKSYKVYSPTHRTSLPSNQTGRGKFIGIAGDWNALPRIPKFENPNKEEYRALAASVLAAHALPDAVVHLQQAVKVDLDGDEMQEIVFSASSPTFSADRVQAGDYSFVAVARQGKITVLRGEFYPREECPFLTVHYSISHILDLDGDGQMEILLDYTGYEEHGKIAYRLQGDEAMKLFVSTGTLVR